MCILFFQLNEPSDETGYRLILASNRDEYWVRPTGTAAWYQQGQWLGGIDLEPGREGGTWLGMAKSGKIAVLLNVLSVLDKNMKGRGNLVTDYLKGERSSGEYLTELSSEMDKYNQYHLYLLNLKEKDPIHYITNSTEEGNIPKTLKPGIYSCTNNDYNQPWQKIVRGQERFADLVNKYGDVGHRDKLLDSIFSLLSDKQQNFPDKQLQSQFNISERSYTGEVIQQRSAAFVWSPSIGYGTRTHTVILVDHQGNCEYVERTYSVPLAETDPEWTSVTHTFSLE